MHGKRMIAVLLASVAVVAIGCGGSGDGSDDQSAEIEALKVKVTELEARNQVLLDRNARLRRQLRESGQPGAEKPPPTDSGATVSEESFQTPSGNIGCSLLGDTARCDIKVKSWDPGPTPADCPVDWGNGLSVGSSGPGEIVCSGDTVMNPSAPTLAYGQTSRVGILECVSEQSGITCTNKSTGHGFTLSKASKSTF